MAVLKNSACNAGRNKSPSVAHKDLLNSYEPYHRKEYREHTWLHEEKKNIRLYIPD